MEPKTGKRIVSKGAYVAAQGKRSALGITGFAMIAVAALTGLLALLLLAWLLVISSRGYSVRVAATIFKIFGLTGVCYVTTRFGWSSLKHAGRLTPGVPLTRANTADLPAPDSLVRASSEPAQAQEAVLLRAAAERQEKHEEQLVQASMGPE